MKCPGAVTVMWYMLFSFMWDVHDAAEGTKQINRAIDGTDLLNGYVWSH